jgi:hypothetical protein
MRTSYFQTPSHAIAVNFKVASGSIARAVIGAFYPQKERLITTPHGAGHGTAYPAGKNADNTRWQSLAPTESEPSQPVLLLVRDPIEKFRSACAESGIEDVYAKLAALQNGWGRDAHFWPQARLCKGQGRLYAFPDHLEAFAADAGLAYPLPTVPSRARAPKPDLTADQLATLATIYAEDIALFRIIASAGQTYTAPPEPATEAERARKLEELAQQRYAAEVGGLVMPNGMRVRTDERTRLALVTARAEARGNPQFAFRDWKLGNGQYVDLTAATITAIYDATLQHVADCFAQERRLSGEVAAAQTAAEVEAVRWRMGTSER